MSKLTNINTATVLRLLLILLLAAVTFFLYSWYKQENLSEYERQNGFLQTQPGSTLPQSPAPVVTVHTDSPVFTGSDSLLPARPAGNVPAPDTIALRQTNSPAASRPTEKTGEALHGPAATFSRSYTLAAGKTLPVDILWSDGGAPPSSFRLLTIKPDDIRGGKVGFIIEDRFSVLLFSRTLYGVGDQIAIADPRHDIAISILRVGTNDVTIQLVSHLNSAMVHSR